MSGKFCYYFPDIINKFLYKFLLDKMILCNNYISNNYCVYKNKCLYAHDINEQNIEQNRKKILDIIKSTEDLSHLELNNPEIGRAHV